MQYTKFKDLVEDINSITEEKVRIVNHVRGLHVGIRFVSKPVPISINESEYNYMYHTIVDNNLKSGFELATGMGISTIAIASAFKRTDGHLITLDSYYEEINLISDNIPVGEYSEVDKKKISDKSKTYNLLKTYMSHKDLNKFVDLAIGWSPNDSIKLLQRKNIPLDFVFLDCPKSDSEFERDLNSIIPFLAKKYVVFVHDTHTFTNRSFELVKNKLGINMERKFKYFENTEYFSTRHFPLGVINNLN